jgi:hypothetical protein
MTTAVDVLKALGAAYLAHRSRVPAGHMQTMMTFSGYMATSELSPQLLLLFLSRMVPMLKAVCVEGLSAAGVAAAVESAARLSVLGLTAATCVNLASMARNNVVTARQAFVTAFEAVGVPTPQLQRRWTGPCATERVMRRR